ncbi:MAG: hypothetical protein ACREJC_12905 [Tepidisphaeraceae bacterium]
MSQRIGAILSLIAFAMCLLVGVFEADNPMSTVLLRALAALVVMYFVGVIVGVMAQKMLEEKLRDESGKLKDSEAEASAADR